MLYNELQRLGFSSLQMVHERRKQECYWSIGHSCVCFVKFNTLPHFRKNCVKRSLAMLSLPRNARACLRGEGVVQLQDL